MEGAWADDSTSVCARCAALVVGRSYLVRPLRLVLAGSDGTMTDEETDIDSHDSVALESPPFRLGGGTTGDADAKNNDVEALAPPDVL